MLAGGRRQPKCLLVGLLGVEEVLLGRAGAGGELPDLPGCRARLGGGFGDARRDIRVPGLREKKLLYIFTAGCSVRWQVLPSLEVGGVNALLHVSLFVCDA